jgi:uncharacterized NAD(P)/FAD-binding protein YdhS
MKNNRMDKQRYLGIIGCGPRGLYALENVISKLGLAKGDEKIQIIVFEETGNFGNGQVYDLDQVATNWINISERILFLNKRPEIHFGKILIPGFLSYHDWSGIDLKLLSADLPDHYPPRAKIGQYLHQRFESLIKPLVTSEVIKLYPEQVINVNYLDTSKIRIETNLNVYEHIDEVLLTIGHQPTETSDQIDGWKKFFIDNLKVSLFENPYPVETILPCHNLSAASIVGIRGFGLAMIDIVRGIANKFGEFQIIDESTQQCEYYTKASIANMLIPFSLDGLPPAPKPLNAKIDRLYQPTDEDISEFESKIGDTATQKNATSSQFLINAISPIVAKVYSQLIDAADRHKVSKKELEQIVNEWLNDDKFEHSLITPRKQSAQKSMEEFVGMATGKGPISLDFCTGQVWRHFQPSIYEQLSFNACNEEVFAEIIQLDERLKRYSYGPPVESIQQMLALIAAGVMNLDFVNDPEISLSPEGWQLVSNGKRIMTNLMINSVLDAPQIKSVDSPIVKNLLSNGLIKAVHDDFGVMTTENGYLIPKDNEGAIPIALLGRLAKGSIIGVDAILECFGKRPENWASESAKRHINWLHSIKNVRI